MEISKNLKEELKMPKEKVTYGDILDLEDSVFYDLITLNNMTSTNVEGFQQYNSGYWWAEDEVSRLMDFVAIAYCELKYEGRLTEQFKHEMELDIPVWDSGEIDKFLDDEEKKLIYEHLAVIKEYLNNKGISCPGETQ